MNCSLRAGSRTTLSYAQDLPQELLLRVFSLLDRPSNARNARVCKTWMEGALDEVWRELDDWTDALAWLADTVTDPVTRTMVRYIFENLRPDPEHSSQV